MEPTQDQMENMSYEQLQALAMGEAPQPAAETPAETPAAPEQEVEQPAADAHVVEQPAETPREERQAEQPATNVEQHDGRTEALRQEREARRQEAAQRQAAETRLAELQAALNDPDRVRQHLKSIAPEPEAPPDYDLDPEGAIHHHLAPLKAELDAMKRENAHMKQQQEHHAYLGGLAEKYGPDFHSTLQSFDANNAHLAHLDPEVRFLAAEGFRSKQGGKSDPAADAARINALAEQKLAALLAGGKAPKGITTLGGGPQSREDKAPSLENVTQSDMERMSIAELQQLARGGG